MAVTKDAFKIIETKNVFDGSREYYVLRAKLKRNIFLPWTYKIKWELTYNSYFISFQEAKEACQELVDREHYKREEIITIWPHKCS
jgi:hypothetical protein